jgi:hypothetical protein
MTLLHLDYQGTWWSKAMRLYSEAVKADVSRRISPPHRQGVTLISAALGIHVITPPITGGRRGGYRDRWSRHPRRTPKAGVPGTNARYYRKPLG